MKNIPGLIEVCGLLKNGKTDYFPLINTTTKNKTGIAAWYFIYYVGLSLKIFLS